MVLFEHFFGRFWLKGDCDHLFLFDHVYMIGDYMKDFMERRITSPK